MTVRASCTCTSGDRAVTPVFQVTVAAAGAVFLVFLLAHHDAAPESRRRHRIDVLTWSVLLDVVDAVDLLGVFLDTAARDNMAEWVEWTIMSIVCLNFVLPTVLLMVLSKTHFGARPLSKVRTHVDLRSTIQNVSQSCHGGALSQMCMWLKLDFFDYTKPLTTLSL